MSKLDEALNHYQSKDMVKVLIMDFLIKAVEAGSNVTEHTKIIQEVEAL